MYSIANPVTSNGNMARAISAIIQRAKEYLAWKACKGAISNFRILKSRPMTDNAKDDPWVIDYDTPAPEGSVINMPIWPWGLPFSLKPVRQSTLEAKNPPEQTND